MSFSGVREERLKTPLPDSPPPPSDAPSPAKSASRSPQFEVPHALDARFSALVHDIQQRLALLARAPTIRVEKWLRKLHDPVSNVTWKKLRNDYARLLRHNLRLGATSPPFDRAPDDGPLRNLLPDEKARFRDDGLGPGARRAGNRFGVAERNHRRRRTTARKASASWSSSVPGAKTNDAAAADDDVEPRDARDRGRDVAFERDAAAARAPRSSRGAFEFDRTIASIDARGTTTVASEPVEFDASEDDTSRETRARVVAAEGVDATTSFSDAGAPVARVLAALGAEREKSRELEWRLRRAETALESCRAELHETRVAARAMREVKAEEVREIRASHKRELDRLIAGLERRRAEVRRPRAKAAPRAAGAEPLSTLRPTIARPFVEHASNEKRANALGSNALRAHGRANATAAEKEGDFFAYLEAFQRGTSALRVRATRGGAE